jgi:predicted AAA+ superfamily ATPase
MLTERNLFKYLKGLKKSVLLLGPRQTGKSTLIQQFKPELTINFADQETFVRHLSDPGLFKRVVANHKSIFVDEVQRLPSVLNTAQVLIDSDKSRRFYFTGSSARKLRRGHANLLPGRVLSFELGPLTYQELKSDFQIERALTRGLLPGVYWESSQDEALLTLKSYALTYLKEEIQAEALTRNLEGFARFFQVTASRSGDFIDFSKFASQAMIERTSARRFFDILKDTLVINEVEAFTKSQKRRLIQHPKFYFFDVGVLNGAVENFSASSDRLGVLFEHLVLQLIVSSAKANMQTLRVSVYRTESHAEVDFIVEIGSEVFAIEVKASRNVGRNDLRGLASFKDFYGKKHKPMIIYLGADDQLLEGVPVLSLASGLAMLGYSD